MKDKLSAFERRLEMLFLLNKCRETTALELSYYFAVSKELNCNPRSRICKTKCDFCN